MEYDNINISNIEYIISKTVQEKLENIMGMDDHWLWIV